MAWGDNDNSNNNNDGRADGGNQSGGTNNDGGSGTNTNNIDDLGITPLEVRLMGNLLKQYMTGSPEQKRRMDFLSYEIMGSSYGKLKEEEQAFLEKKNVSVDELYKLTPEDLEEWKLLAASEMKELIRGLREYVRNAPDDDQKGTELFGFQYKELATYYKTTSFDTDEPKKSFKLLILGALVVGGLMLGGAGMMKSSKKRKRKRK